MLRLSRAVRAALARAPHDRHLADAQVALWRGQANDAYWHGVFGGCYLPHLRRAVKSALLECERRLTESAALPTPAWTREDGNGDGREEIYVRTRELAVTLNPALGGAITELGYLAGDLDVADVLARRPEAYHAKVRGASREDGAPAVRTITTRRRPRNPGSTRCSPTTTSAAARCWKAGSKPERHRSTPCRRGRRPRSRSLPRRSRPR